jgi:ABC-type transporter MlaC component
MEMTMNKKFSDQNENTISPGTKITIGLMITIVSGIISFIIAMNTMASKEYVNDKLTAVKETIEKEQESIKKDNEYIRNKVDAIYNFLLKQR